MAVSPSRVRRTQQERSAAMRLRLLDAAVDCLYDLGYSGHDHHRGRGARRGVARRSASSLSHEGEAGHRGSSPRSREAPRRVSSGVLGPARGNRQARRRHRHLVGEALVQGVLRLARARRRRADGCPASRSRRGALRPVPRSGAVDDARLLRRPTTRRCSRSTWPRLSRSPPCRASRSIASSGPPTTVASIACSSALRAGRDVGATGSRFAAQQRARRRLPNGT